jgi:hypothetical protein
MLLLMQQCMPKSKMTNVSRNTGSKGKYYIRRILSRQPLQQLVFRNLQQYSVRLA